MIPGTARVRRRRDVLGQPRAGRPRASPGRTARTARDRCANRPSARRLDATQPVHRPDGDLARPRSTSHPYAPALTAGKATVRAPSPAATSSERVKHDASSAGSVSPACAFGPTVWTTQRAGSRPAVVATASPTGRPSGSVGAAQPVALGEQRTGRRGRGWHRRHRRPPSRDGVRRVDDRVDLLLGDVALDGFDAHGPQAAGSHPHVQPNAGDPASGLEQDRHRTVVDELDRHVGPERRRWPP